MGAIISQIIITDKYFDDIFKKRKNNKIKNVDKNIIEQVEYKYTSLLPCCKR